MIGYASRTLSKPERNYCVTRRELLAVVTYLRHFRPYLYGRHIIVRTDHGALRWLINFKDPVGQVARWLEILGEYNYTVVHRPGRSHQNADSLSRKVCTQCGWKAEQQTTKSTAEPNSREEATFSALSPNKEQRRQLNLRVHWQEPLIEIQYFEYDPEERSNMSRVKEYYDHIGQCRITKLKVNQKDSEPKVAPTNMTTEAKDMGGAPIKTRQVNIPPLWTKDEMVAEQETDPDMSLVMKAKQTGAPRPSWKDISPLSKSAKTYWAEWDRLETRDGMLHRRWESHDGKVIRWQLLVPQKYKEPIMKELHDAKTAAHLGIHKLREKISERFWWYGVTVDCRSWVRKCDTCARRKSPTTRRRAPLQQEIAGHNLQRVAMDIMGPLPVSEQGNRYILVVGDYFSKWIEAYAIPNQEASTCAKVFTEEWICRHGCPRILHSDRGTNFESHLMADVCSLLGIEKTRTTPMMPKSDGLIERFNRSMMNTVAVLIDPDNHQKDWDEVLPYALMAYRSSVQESTGESPHMMMYGENITLPVDLYSFPVEPEQDKDLKTDFGQELRDKLRIAHEQARTSLKKAAERQKRNYDSKGVLSTPYTEGTFVWLHNEIRKKGYNPKLQFKWDGPYLVLKKLSDVVYRIQKSPKSKPRVIHFDRLKPYKGEERESWLPNQQ